MRRDEHYPDRRQTLKYNPASWRLPYDHVVLKDPKQILVTYCLQFLLVLLLYPIPDDGYGTPQKNYYRHYLGRLHRPQDFQFLQDGMTRILHQPVRCMQFVSFRWRLTGCSATSNLLVPTRKSEVTEVGP